MVIQRLGAGCEFFLRSFSVFVYHENRFLLKFLWLTHWLTITWIRRTGMPDRDRYELENASPSFVTFRCRFQGLQLQAAPKARCVPQTCHSLPDFLAVDWFQNSAHAHAISTIPRTFTGLVKTGWVKHGCPTSRALFPAIPSVVARNMYVYTSDSTC
jgi:hypothetical protein